jgi:hypothetical protein
MTFQGLRAGLSNIVNDAALYPAARTAVLVGEREVESAVVRRQITAAVEELQRERRPDEAVN